MKKNAIVMFVLGACFLSPQAFSQNKKNGKETAPIFEIEGRTPSQPSTLSIQNKYVGKIMFSDQQLTMANTSESAFKSSFKLGDPIYARVFTSNAVENYMLYDTRPGQPQGATENMRYSYTIYYFVDSVQIMGWEQGNKGDMRGVNTWQRFVMLDPKSGKAYDLSSQKQRDAINSLSPGLHKVRVEIWAGESKELSSIKPIAVGEFDLTVGGNSKMKIGKTWADVHDGKIDSKVKADVIGLYTKYVKNQYPDITFKGFKVPSDDYGIQRNEYKLIEFRSVLVYAYGVDKNGKCFIYSGLYTQKYQGGGQYSSVFSRWGENNIDEIDCE